MSFIKGWTIFNFPRNNPTFSTFTPHRWENTGNISNRHLSAVLIHSITSSLPAVLWALLVVAAALGSGAVLPLQTDRVCADQESWRGINRAQQAVWSKQIATSLFPSHRLSLNPSPLQQLCSGGSTHTHSPSLSLSSTHTIPLLLTHSHTATTQTRAASLSISIVSSALFVFLSC